MSAICARSSLNFKSSILKLLIKQYNVQLCQKLLVCSKFKFCFLKLFEFFQIFFIHVSWIWGCGTHRYKVSILGKSCLLLGASNFRHTDLSSIWVFSSWLVNCLSLKDCSFLLLPPAIASAITPSCGSVFNLCLQRKD